MSIYIVSMTANTNVGNVKGYIYIPEKSLLKCMVVVFTVLMGPLYVFLL